MPGPAPKNPRVRQRRNRAATAASLLQEKRARIRAPRLPAATERVLEERPVYDQDGTPFGVVIVQTGETRSRVWHPMTRAWWHDIWHSPMRAEFHQVDLHRLYILADLTDRYWQSPSVQLAMEIRLQGQAFGLTPIDRRRLQWDIRDDAPPRRAEQRSTGRLAPSTSPTNVDPRALLSVV